MRKRTPLSVFGCLLLAVASTWAQQPRPNSCPTHITSCGCVITSTDTYVVDNDLNANQTSAPNCIEIAADHAVLNLKGMHVEGNGSGIGILIRQSAHHAVLEGGDESPAGPPGHFNGTIYDPATPQAKVFSWNIGIEDDADDAFIGLFDQIGGSTFQQDEGNNIGLLLNAVHGTLATGFNAQYNRAVGVMAQNSSGLSLTDFSSSGGNPHGNIQPIGVMFDSTNDSSIGPASMDHNHVYGLWLARSSRNVVLDSNGTSHNEDTGILIGCGSLHCRGNESSDSNKITASGAPQNTLNGIVIEHKNHNNIITVTHNDGNPNGHDMVDLNPHCDSNVWYNNTGTSNQSCIH